MLKKEFEFRVGEINNNNNNHKEETTTTAADHQQNSNRSSSSKIIKLCRNSFHFENTDIKSQVECSRRFSVQACNILNQLRYDNQLCDAKIKVDDGTEFLVHRAILSASSRYFYALFTNGMDDSLNQTVHIKEVDSDVMNHIIEWCYMRETVIKYEYVENLLIAADKYQVLGLVDSCSEFLQQNINPENSIGINDFANTYFLKSLQESSHNYIMKNFAFTAERSTEWLELSLNALVDLLSNDELNVKSEELIFDVIIKWIEHDIDERRQNIFTLLKCIRTGLLSKDYFIEKVRSHDYIRESDDCRGFIIETLKYLYELDMDTVGLMNMNNFMKPFAKPRLPHEALFVFGGWSGGSPTNAIEIYDTRAERWYTAENPDMLPRAYHGSVTVDGKIYIIGGFDGVEYYNTCKVFEPKTQKWTEISPMHSKRCYVSVAELNKVIYALGGCDGNFRHNTVEKYVIEKNQWSFVSPMHYQRSDANATTLDGYIYICGGFNGLECLNTAERYNPITNQWTLITSMTKRRSGVGVISYKNCVYAIGGFDGITRMISGEKYNPKTMEWEMIQTMYTPRSNFAIEVLDGYLFVIGGFNGIATIYHVECYDDENDEWLKAADMNIYRSAVSACVLSGLENIRSYIKRDDYDNADQIAIEYD